MKPLLAILCTVCLPACTVINGTTADGSRYTYATLGGDATDLDLGPDRTTAASVATAPSFREVASVAKTAVVVSGLVDGTKAVTGAVKSVKNAATAAKVTNTSTNASAAVEEARIKADLSARLAEITSQQQ